MNKRLLCIAIGAALAAASTASASEAPAALKRLEAKWLGVMTKIRGWNAEAINQFREGYREYPPQVLEKALAAETFEAMQATLDAHAGKRAQEAMQKAMKVYAIGATRPEDADNPQVAEARAMVGKALGDDARDLVFIPITPCTVWDTRFATNPDSMGMVNNATTKRFYSHLDGAGGSYAAYGGNPSCPETAQNFIGVRPFAVMMTVYINDPSAQGWLTFYRDGDPDPSFATISVYYSPGPTRTQAVISKSSRGYGSGTYDIAATSRFANTNASASVTGYFVKVADAGTVTSVATGPGLTGGPITSSGTIGLAATNLLPTAPCAGTQVPRWNGSAWECSNDIDTNSGGTVTAVNAGALLESSGGTTPSISFAAAAAGTVLAGTGAAPAFTGSPALSGNLVLEPSTATTGNVMKGLSRFLHNIGFANVYLGENAGMFLTTGSDNTAVGWLAMAGGTLGSENTAVGSRALQALLGGHGNTAVGLYALGAAGNSDYNTAVGALALRNNSTGEQNSALGSWALSSNTSAFGNTAMGHEALAMNTTGSHGTAVGSGSLGANVTGHRNTSVGHLALATMTGGTENAALGVSALGAANGDNNVAIGAFALQTNAAGSNNTAVGKRALGDAPGSNNIGIGAFSGEELTSGDNNILIGYVNPGGIAHSGTVRIGTPLVHTRAFVEGIRGATTGVADAIPVMIDSAGQLGTISSSARTKAAIADMGDETSALMRLRPVSFQYRAHGAEGPVQYGLIAEEVEQVYPNLVAKRRDGSAETVMYHQLPPMLLNEMQKQQRTIEELQAQVARLERLLGQESTKQAQQGANRK